MGYSPQQVWTLPPTVKLGVKLTQVPTTRRFWQISYVQKPVSLATFSKAIVDILSLPDESERPGAHGGVVE